MSAPNELDSFIECLVSIGTEQLRAGLNLPLEKAEPVMRRVADQVCVAYARRFIYVPVAYDPRNREIVEKYGRQGATARPYTAERIDELAQEYQLTVRRIQQIVAEARDADFAARQGRLPGLDEAS